MKWNRVLMTCLLSLTFFFSCSQKDSPAPVKTNPPPPAESTPPSAEVMMQAFYWDVTPGGVWWDTLSSKLDTWKSAGITTLWLPVVSKGQSGQYSMGYDPYDYFDFGQYDQMGTVETRFGSYAELKSLLGNARTKGFKLIADIVLNHNGGGDAEANPRTGTSTYTKFAVKSGRFIRNYEDFHPSAIDAKDEDVFGQYPDVCHNVPYVQDWLWKRPDGIAKFYRDSLGFSGWRFDFVKGFNPSVVKNWLDAAGGTSIVEYYDGNVGLVNNYVTASGSGAFDFPLMFSIKDALNGNDLTKLNGAGLIAVNASRAYTFIANHDVDDIFPQNKLKAYTIILTSEGTPFIFYKDYESLLDKTKLNTLITIRKTLAAGTTTRLYSSQTEYIFSRNGTPGLVTYINNGATGVQQKVQTHWAGTILKDYTGSNPDVTTDAGGYVTVACKVNSYAVYAPK